MGGLSKSSEGPIGWTSLVICWFTCALCDRVLITTRVKVKVNALMVYCHMLIVHTYVRMYVLYVLRRYSTHIHVFMSWRHPCVCALLIVCVWVGVGVWVCVHACVWRGCVCTFMYDLLTSPACPYPSHSPRTGKVLHCDADV